MEGRWVWSLKRRMVFCIPRDEEMRRPRIGPSIIKKPNLSLTCRTRQKSVVGSEREPGCLSSTKTSSIPSSIAYRGRLKASSPMFLCTHDAQLSSSSRPFPMVLWTIVKKYAEGDGFLHNKPGVRLQILGFFFSFPIKARYKIEKPLPFLLSIIFWK